MKKAFTLIELLVVIGILGILSAIMMTSFSGSTESARAAKCLTNMRNLAAACQTYAMANWRYPTAGSTEYSVMDESSGIKNVKEVYHEKAGWISWASQGKYANKPTASRAAVSSYTSCYDQDDERRRFCITNGVLWKYVSENHEVYVCPSHRQTMSSYNPNWSYAMNAYFIWTPRPGTDCYDDDDIGIGYVGFKKADRRLLFAEINFTGYNGEKVETKASPCTELDCILQYKGAVNTSENESIGFNHKTGNMTYGHVAFADGHVEKLVYPRSGLSQTELQNLTQWLCEGTDVSFSGSKYEKLEN